MVSFESTEGTNWLLINSPVGTVIVLPVAGMVILATAAMVGVALRVVEWRSRRGVVGDPRRRPGNIWWDCAPDKQGKTRCFGARWRGADSDRRRSMQRQDAVSWDTAIGFERTSSIKGGPAAILILSGGLCSGAFLSANI